MKAYNILILTASKIDSYSEFGNLVNLYQVCQDGVQKKNFEIAICFINRQDSYKLIKNYMQDE